MIKSTLVFLFICLTNLKLVFSQQKQGIAFDTISTWAEIKEKAKKDNKYIFVDCFATWCGPCKMMDRDVYSLDSIGEFFNSKFISIKLQMDKSENDSRYVKMMYKTADEFLRLYRLVGYPSFLFFSPNGELVHKSFGYKDPTLFKVLGDDASNPAKQYAVLKKKYIEGNIKKETELRNIIIVARSNGDFKFSHEIATKFKIKYLDKISRNKICTFENIVFFNSFIDLITSKDNIFKLCFEFPQKVDNLKKGLAKTVVNFVIEKEEITEKVMKGDSIIWNNPNWNFIYDNITKKYGEKYADELVLPARIRFAFKIKNWKEYAQLKDSEIKMKRLDTVVYSFPISWDLNMAAWNTYLKCDDSVTLNRALAWSELSIKLASSKIPNPTEQYYDTKARILYKLGRNGEAIENEQKAINLGDESARRNGGKRGTFSEDYFKVLIRMKNNESIVGLD